MKHYRLPHLLIATLILLLAVNVLPTSTQKATAAPDSQTLNPYEDRSDPVLLIMSYYNAILRGEYNRAYSYWDFAPNGATLTQFSQGFANTADIFVVVSTLIREGVAAGTTYVAIPTMVLSTEKDGTQRAYVGCMVGKVSTVETTTDTNVFDNPWFLADEPSGFTEIESDNIPAAFDVNYMRESCEPPALNDIPYDLRGNPVQLLRSYFNAVHLRDYARAYAYWGSPPNGLTFSQFSAGYANTTDIFVAVRLPIGFDGAAGSIFSTLQTILIGTETVGNTVTQTRYSGCYVARTSNVGDGATPPIPFWSFYSAHLEATIDVVTDYGLLTSDCEL